MFLYFEFLVTQVVLRQDLEMPEETAASCIDENSLLLST